MVTFHKLAPGKSKVMLQRFKEFIESQGSETGAWRGEVEQEKN